MPEGLRRAIFLDRDGTLTEEKVYLSDPEGVVLLPGAAAALSDLRDGGFALVVVTNQSGIARGLYSEDEYHAVAKRLADLLHDLIPRHRRRRARGNRPGRIAAIRDRKIRRRAPRRRV